MLEPHILLYDIFAFIYIYIYNCSLIIFTCAKFYVKKKYIER